MTPVDQPRLPTRLTVVYGLVVVAAFGSWFYGYGVLISPIVADTGWSEGWLSTAYGAGLFLVGLGALVTGRAIDRVGPRSVFAVCATGVAVGAVVTATAPNQTVFVLAAMATQTFVGSAGYYVAVHATIARLSPDDRTRAITVNTLWGALASPIYLPSMALSVTLVDWRPTVLITNATVVAAFLLAAACSPAHVPTLATGPRRSVLGDLHHSVTDPVIRRLLLVALCSGFVFSVLFLYQVPVMITAGLALGTASALAGLRGLFQLAGRLPLPWLVRRFGSQLVFRVGLVMLAAAILVMPLTGNPVIAVTFAVVAGFAVGAASTLESVHSAEVVDVAAIGMVLGTYSLVRGIGAAIGPVTGGALTELAGSRFPALVMIAVLALVAAVWVPRKAEAG
ncbi:MFS transporter [Nocardioides limicola]|uniref:MFS transporter n=1 Tax=Nocardioides limicola TaxID=2803368 RepID=UPI00193B515F|nr:MFS transporter [Nocardioides sp. DJM-14]